MCPAHAPNVRIHADTANSIIAAISLIKEAYRPKQIILISLIISQEGLRVLNEEHPDITIHAASVTDRLTADGHMVPGVGDVGDRLFSSVVDANASAPANPEFYTDPTPDAAAAPTKGSPKKRQRKD